MGYDELQNTDEPDGGWTKESFDGLTYKNQRAVLCRDFKQGFFRRDNNHVGLRGTKYNFYVKQWMFGYPELIKNNKDPKKEDRYTMVYFTFESLLDMDLPQEVQEFLVFHIDFFSAKKNPRIGWVDPIDEFFF